MTDPKITVNGDMKSVDAMFAKMERENAKLKNSLDILAKRSKRASQESTQGRKAEAAAARKLRQAIEGLKGPAERYRDTVKSYQQALQSGAITEQQYKQLREQQIGVLNRTRDAMIPIAEASDRQARAQRKANAEGERIRQSILTPTERLHQAQRRLIELRKRGVLSEREFAAAQRKVVAEHKREQLAATGAKTSVLRSVVAMGAGYLGFQQTVGRVFSYVSNRIRGAIDENKELASAIDEVMGKLPEKEVKLQIQADLSDEEIRKKLPQIQKNILKLPATDLAGGFVIETQLASSGFSEKDVKSGKALESSLRIMAATNQFGESVDASQMTEGTKAIAQFLKAQGDKDPAADAIERVGGKLATLFEKSDVQFPDLTDLAKVTAVMQSLDIGEDIKLAFFSAMRDVGPAADSATALRQVTSRLRTASTSDKKVKALGEIGLKPQDIDLIGEDLPTAMKRLKMAFDDVRKSRGVEAGDLLQSTTLKTLFGERGMSGAATMMSQLPVAVDRIQQLQGAQDKVDRGVAAFQGSRFARNQRRTVRTQVASTIADMKTGGVTLKEAKEELESIAMFLKAESPEAGIEIADALNQMKGALDAGAGFGLSARDILLDDRITGIADRFGSGGVDDDIVRQARRNLFPGQFSASPAGAIGGLTIRDGSGNVRVDGTNILGGNLTGNRAALPEERGTAMIDSLNDATRATKEHTDLLRSMNNRPPVVVPRNANAHTE